MGRLLPRGVEIPAEERVDFLELAVGLGDGVAGAEHLVRVLGARCLGAVKVDRPETEAFREPEHGLMIGVDQLPAPLADLSVSPVSRRVRVNPAPAWPLASYTVATMPASWRVRAAASPPSPAPTMATVAPGFRGGPCSPGG